MPADIESLYARGLIGDDQMEKLRATMTHEAERGNPAAPYLRDAGNFASGGVSGVMRGRGVEVPEVLPRWLSDALQNPDNEAAMGMASGVSAAKGIANKTLGTLWSDPANIDKLRRLKAQGKSLSEIASEFGVARGVIAGKLDRLGKLDAPAASGAPGLPNLKFMSGAAQDIDPTELREFLRIFGGR